VITRKPRYDDDSIVYNPSYDKLLEYVLYYISGYEGYLYPVIIGLSNYIQINKLTNLLTLLQNNDIKGGYHLFFDEADVTYLNLRHKLLSFIIDKDKYDTNKEISVIPKNYGTYWITATGYGLINGASSFEECHKAHQVHIKLSEPVIKGYRDINNGEVHLIEHSNFSITKLLTENKHFKKPLEDGSFRRIIAVGPLITAEQEGLAKMIVELGYNVITINTHGMNYHSMVENTIKTKRIRLTEEINKTLATLYHDEPGIKSKPLLILGNRKIDRGITFHYSSNDEYRLIWTDVMIPRIINWKRAIQVAGRGAGVINDDVKVHYWVEETTYKRIMKYIKFTDPNIVESGITYKPINNIYTELKESKK
jgi:hypothetical protein